MCKELTLEQRREPYWQKLESVIGAESTAAMKEIYALYTDELVDWFASLYDVQTGGYYYSESARDNEGFLPDAESTSQALRILSDCGAIIKYGNNYAKALPTEMAEQIIDFVYNLQDKNGYFYHPQWSKDLVNQKTSRRSRDLGHCTGILSKFGVKPKYTPANQTATEDMAYIAPLTTPLGNSSAIAVSR